MGPFIHLSLYIYIYIYIYIYETEPQLSVSPMNQMSMALRARKSSTELTRLANGPLASLVAHSINILSTYY